MREIKLFEKYHLSKLEKQVDAPVKELLEAFYQFDKLSYNFNKDLFIIREYYEKSQEKDFDPYSHLQANDLIDEKKDCLLSFGDNNEKMKKLGVVYFSLPAGYTCPFADICKSFAHKTGGKFANGKSIRDEGIYRCYAASTELAYPSVREQRWRNLDLINQFKTKDEKADLILRSIKYYENHNKKISILRIHESGDFMTQDYFDAWMMVAEKRKDILFYGYTKAIEFIVARLDRLPINFRLTGSVGGKQDELLFKTPQIRKAFIVKTEEEARQKRLNIDINDFLAIGGDTDYALLLHGTQSAESGLTRLSRKNSELTRDKSKKFTVSRQMLQAVANKYTI